ncbi:hypothetical protein PspCFBP13528_10035 [Pseudomonas sp. CFBP13528]|nr:hypothetical protein PspCFBP13528_10035 [Pseudomonas sp. CFBP13528]
MLVKVVNDNASGLMRRGALRCFASKLAPTVGRGQSRISCGPRISASIRVPVARSSLLKPS